MNRSEMQALSRGHQIGYAEGVTAGLLMAARVVRGGEGDVGAGKLLRGVAGSLERLAGTLGGGEVPPLSGSGGRSPVAYIRSLPSEPVTRPICPICHSAVDSNARLDNGDVENVCKEGHTWVEGFPSEYVTPVEPLGTGCTGDPCGANGCPKCDGLLPFESVAYIGKRTGTPRFEGTPTEPLTTPTPENV